MIRQVRAIGRMVAVSIVLAYYILSLRLRMAFSDASRDVALAHRRGFTEIAMQLLGIRVSYFGEGHDAPVLYVSNHRSLVDPVVELHNLDAYILSKAEVSRYPLIGDGARLTGVIFVDRDSPESRQSARQMIAKTLAQGDSVLIYPEGTTSNFNGTREFKRGGFQAAWDAPVPIVPVAVAYGDASDHWHEGPMLPFFIRKFGKRRTYVAVRYGTPLSAGSLDESVSEARDWIEAEIRALEDFLADKKAGDKN